MMRGVAAGERTRTGGRAVGAALLAVGLTALLAVTGGCDSSEPEPTPSSIAPTTSSPTPTPTETPLAEPTMPPEMDRDDEAGAVAAAEYFMELLNYTIQTGDLDSWAEVADRNCGFCLNVSNDLGPIYAEGGRYSGGTITVSTARLVGFDETLRVHAIEVAYEETESRVLDGEGNVVDQSAARSGWLVLDVGATSDGWRLLTGDARDKPVDL